MHFNLLSFQALTETITANRYSAKADETHPPRIYRDECPELWVQNTDKFANCKHLFCSFVNEIAFAAGL
jgi:hypothetical protein